MYQLSLYSYKVKNTDTGEIFQQNNGSPADIIYNEWLNLGNNPEFLQYFADELAEIETANVMMQLRDVLGVISRQALLISMNRNEQEDLAYFEVAYRTKYALCKGYRTDPENTIFQESLLEGYATVELFKTDVISKFEAGEQLRDTIIQLTEVTRKAIFKDIENNDFVKPIQRIQILYQITTVNATTVIPLIQSAIAL